MSIRKHSEARIIDALNEVEAGRQGCALLSDLLRTKQSGLAPRLSVVEVFVARQAAVNRLAQQVSQRQVRVLPARAGQALLDESAQSQTFIQHLHQNQATV
jgi:hypothetical protein